MEMFKSVIIFILTAMYIVMMIKGLKEDRVNAKIDFLAMAIINLLCVILMIK